MLNRRRFTQLLLTAPFAARAGTSREQSANGLTESGSKIDLRSLPAVAAPNPTAYRALNVPRMAAGRAFSDPVTGTRTVKLTSYGTPATTQFQSIYSTL